MTIFKMEHVLGLALIVLYYYRSGARGESIFKKGRHDPEITIFNRNYTGVYFDLANFMKYNGLSMILDEAGTSALVKKIYSQFDHIMVPIGGNSSNHLVPEVVAHQNKKHLAGINASIMQVIILYRWNNWEEDKRNILKLDRLRQAADRANDIFSGTVRTILLEVQASVRKPLRQFYEFREHFRQTCEDGRMQGHQYNVGIQLNMKQCEVSSEVPIWEDVLHYGYPKMVYFLQSVNTRNTVDSVEGHVNVFTDAFAVCTRRVHGVSREMEVGFMSTWPDTGLEGRLKYSNLVEFWELMDSWAGKTNTSMFFLQAFDSPLDPDMSMKTNGWWRLVPNSSYKAPSHFLFHEKRYLEDSKSGSGSHGLNLMWLRKKFEVNSNLVGIGFNPFTLKKSIGNINNTNDKVIQTAQLGEVTKTFSKLLISVEASNKDIPNLVATTTIAMLNNNESQFQNKTIEVTLAFDQVTANYTMELVNKLNSSVVKALLYRPKFELNNEIVEEEDLKLFRSRNVLASYQFDIDIQLPLELCQEHEQFIPLIEKHSFKKIYFWANVSTANSKLGVRRMLPQLIALLENCKRKVANYFEKLNATMEIGFVAGWPLIGEEKLEDLIQLVRFWEGLNDWAGKTNTSLFLINAFDAPDPVPNKSSAKYGWWRLDEEFSKTGGRFVFKHKKEDALRHAEELVAKDDNLTSELFSFLHISIMLALVMALLVVSLAAVTYYLRKRKSEYLTDAEIADFFNGGATTAEDELVQKFNSAYNKELELPETSFQIDDDKSSVLGSGEFGEVRRGTIQKEGKKLEEVAVKMTKTRCTRPALRGLVFEVKILSFLGQHEHIVELKGAYTAKLKKSKMFVFLELCPLGSLKSYLKKFAPKTQIREEDAQSLNDFQPEPQPENIELDEQLARDMLRWAREIANGMEFIASKHVVHMDLAIRNILLTADKRAKITDFGLSRRMSNYLSYKKDRQEQELLPWRSMAPESLRKLEFTEKSDVWGFGVTLWEMFSLGAEPYAGLNYNEDFLKKLEQGKLRLEQPVYNRNEMYFLMLRCWNINPQKRASFSMLAKKLSQAPTGIEDSECLSEEDSVPITADRLASKDEILSQHNQNPSNLSSNPNCGDGDNANVDIQRALCNCNFASNAWPKRFSWSLMAILILCLVVIVPLIIIFPIPNMTGDASAGQKTSVKVFRPAVGDVGAAENQTNSYQNSNTSLLKPQTVTTNMEDERDFPSLQTDAENNTFLLHQLLNNGTTMTPARFHKLTKYLVENNHTSLLETPGGSFSATPLHWAVYRIKIEENTLSLLQRACVNFNTVDDNGTSVFMYAVEGGRRIDFLSKLASYGADWRFPIINPGKRSQLHFAAQAGNVEGTKFFLKLGLDINGVDSHKNTPLHIAIQLGTKNVLEVVEFLVGKGADVNAKNDRLWTPLYGAAVFGVNRIGLGDSLKLIKYLIEQKADPFSAARAGRTFLHELLLAHGSKLSPSQFQDLCSFLASNGHSKLFNVPEDTKGVTPLHLAVYQLEIYHSTLSILHENGVDLNAADNSKETPLFYAIRGKRSHRFFQHIVQFNADWRHLNKDEWSLLHAAARWNNLEALDFFSSLGLDINQEEEVRSDTPLHVAAQFGNEQLLEMVRFLVEESRADVNKINGRHMTPLHYLARYNTAAFEVIMETIKYLVTSGVNPNLKDRDGATFLDLVFKRHTCFTYDNLQVLRGLFNSSFDVNTVDASKNNYLHNVLLIGRKNVLGTVQFLVENGVGLNATNYQHETSIYAATLSKNIDVGSRLQIIKYLIGKGADVFSQSDGGHTFLHELLAENTDLTPGHFHDLAKYLTEKGHSKIFGVVQKVYQATPFQLAVRELELEEATLALLKDSGVNFNQVGRNGATVLFYSVVGNRSRRLVSQLIQFGANPKHLDDENRTLLHVAARVGNSGAIPILLREGLDINAVDGFQDTPLHKAVQFGKYSSVMETVEFLVGNGADVNATGDQGKSPIHAAALNNDVSRQRRLQLIKYLMEKKADPVAQMETGHTFLHLLLGEGSKLTPSLLGDLCKYLIENGHTKIFDLPENSDGSTPLQYAFKAIGLDTATLSLLRENNVSFNTLDRNGHSILYYSVLGHMSPRILSSLIRLGADPTQLNNVNQSLLHFAGQFGNTEALKVLLEEGLSINGVDMFEDTPLHKVLAFGKKSIMEAVKILVENGADVNSTNYLGRTPIYVLTLNTNIGMEMRLQLIHYLIENGADVFLVAESGRTFLHGLLAKGTKVTSKALHDLAKYIIGKGYSKLFEVAEKIQGATPLHWAVQELELEEATLSLWKDSGVNFSVADKHGYSVLFYSLFGNKGPTQITNLINCGVDPKQLNNRNHSLLHVAAQLGNIDGMEILVEAGLNINAVDWFQDAPLHKCLQFGKRAVMETVKFLVESGADVNAANYQLETPIYTVTLNENIEKDVCLHIIKFLIEKEADVLSTSDTGRTFLHGLLADGTTTLTPSQLHDITKLMVEKGYAKLFEVVEHEHGSTPFHWAVKDMDVENKTLLLLKESGFNFNSEDGEGYSLLFYVVLGGRRPNLITALISYGADVKHTNNKNQSLLLFAAYYENVEGLKLLLNRGLDVNAVDVDGNTPLHFAVEFGTEEKLLEITRLLMEAGANAKVKNNQGMTPLAIATAREDMQPYREKVMELLQSAGRSLVNHIKLIE